MNRITFYSVITLSLIYVVLTVVETWMYQTWDMTVAQQKDIQVRLANAQRIHTGTQQLLRRMGIESGHDPALLEVLKKNHIKVVVNDPEAPAPSNANTPAPVAPPPASHP